MELKTSVRASGNTAFQKLPEIYHFNDQKFVENLDFIDHLSNFRSSRFVPDWNHSEITPNTYRLYNHEVHENVTKEYVHDVKWGTYYGTYCFIFPKGFGS